METEEKDNKLRFGIIVDDLKMQLWQVNVVKMLVANGVSLSLIVKIQGQSESFGKKASGAVRKIYTKMFFSSASRKITSLNEQVEISGIPIKSSIGKVIDGVLFLNDGDIEFIKSQGLDFMVRLNKLSIGGELTESLPHGVWEFCFHDEKTYTESYPDGFWEYVSRGTNNAVSLQRITHDRNSTVILKKNHYPIVKKSYKEHVEQMLTDSQNLAVQACKDIIVNGRVTGSEDTRIGDERKTGVGFGGFLKYIRVTLWRKMTSRPRDFNSFDHDIGIAETPVFDFFNDPHNHRKKIRWLRRKSITQRYMTPSVITTAKDTYVFFAVTDRRDNKNFINMVKKSEQYKKQYTVLDNGHNLCYPFVFRKDEAIFCLPQDTDSSQLTLYRFDEDNNVLEKDNVIYDGIKAYRPTIMFNNGRWNIFYGKEDSYSTKLFLLTSDDLRGPYTQFFNNPVKTDCRNAMMAGGFIFVNGKTYRPAYDNSRRSVVLNEVDEMTASTYLEHEKENLKVGRIKWSRFGKGAHCVSGNDMITAIDGMR